LDEIETEVKCDYNQSIRRAILNHILLDPEERKRLNIQTYPIDYPPIIIHAPVPWHCTFQISSQMLDHKFFIGNPVLLSLRDLWEFQ
jgi:dynein heavy chain